MAHDTGPLGTQAGPVRGRTGPPAVVDGHPPPARPPTQHQPCPGGQPRSHLGAPGIQRNRPPQEPACSQASPGDKVGGTQAQQNASQPASQPAPQPAPQPEAPAPRGGDEDEERPHRGLFCGALSGAFEQPPRPSLNTIRLCRSLLRTRFLYKWKKVTSHRFVIPALQGTSDQRSQAGYPGQPHPALFTETGFHWECSTGAAGGSGGRAGWLLLSP